MRLYRKFFFAALLLLVLPGALWAQQQVPIPFFDVNVRQAADQQEVALSLQILLLLSVLTIAPSILIMMTSFIRVSIVLKFVQRALSLQQEPPNQVIMGMALFITFFIMAPTVESVYDNAYRPYAEQQINTEQFFERSLVPIREFMFDQTREKDIEMFLGFARKGRPERKSDVGTEVLIPAFVISEITKAFTIGIYIFVPFIVIDMVVAAVLMSMGMIMVPPVMVSLPFKIILFVLMDGWSLIIGYVVGSFT